MSDASSREEEEFDEGTQDSDAGSLEDGEPGHRPTPLPSHPTD